MSRFVPAALVLVSSLAAGPAALAQDVHRHTPAVGAVAAPNAPECYCRAQGRQFAPGETICLRTGEGARLAECRMVINVMSWSVTDRTCPEA